MTSLLAGLFAQDNFIPHGFCLAWEPALVWLHVISDSVIAVAYYTIPFALIYFISRRRDLAFRGIFALTGTFILACGTTHIMGVLTLWYPDYWLDGMVKLFTRSGVDLHRGRDVVGDADGVGAAEHGAARGREPSPAA
jgi:hypothetical protein